MKNARVRIIKHEAVPQCGSFEVRFADGKPSQYFYWDDLPGRRLDPATLDHETALESEGACEGHCDPLRGVCSGPRSIYDPR